MASSKRSSNRGAFTLVELMITIAIIGIMTGMVVFAMFQSTEAAKEAKTRALIAKLNGIIMDRYESYRTRRVPYAFPTSGIISSNSPAVRQYQILYQAEISKARLDCIRDLMRMEMPERWNDVVDDPVAPYAHSLPPECATPAYAGTIQRPSVNVAYKRKYDAAAAAGKPATVEHQYAECLYMIVMENLAQEGDSRDVFKGNDVGDLDGDGFPEFLDGWRRPIRFLRWAGGYTSPVNQLCAGIVANANVNGQTASVRLKPSPSFGPDGANKFIGGVMAVLVDGRIDANRMCKITGYDFPGPSCTFTFETKSPLPPPFPGGKPNNNETVVLMAADPFDARGIYPKRTASPFTDMPTFAMYPLVFSAGGDGAFGVVCDVDGGLQYATTARGLMPIVSDNSNQMMGTKKAVNGDPENSWLDNITSHDLSSR